MNNHLPALTVILDREAQRRNGKSSERKECLSLLAVHEPYVELLRKLNYIRDARPAYNELAKAGFSTDEGMVRKGLDSWWEDDREKVIGTLTAQIYLALDRKFAPIQRRILERAAEQVEADVETARCGEIEIAKKYGAPPPDESPLIYALRDLAQWCRGQAVAPTNSGWCGDARKALSYYFDADQPL